ncbi:unnamed protein product, partial [Ixodes pacificus]
ERRPTPSGLRPGAHLHGGLRSGPEPEQGSGGWLQSGERQQPSPNESVGGHGIGRPSLLLHHRAPGVAEGEQRPLRRRRSLHLHGRVQGRSEEELHGATPRRR